MKDVFAEDREIYLDTRHKKLGGVCAGVANYLDLPRFWVRVAAVIGLLIHPPSVLLAYGLAYFILDGAPEATKTTSTQKAEGKLRAD
jgi:phage shock protein C